MLTLMISVNRLLTSIIIVIIIASCAQSKKTYTIQGYTQGTTYNIKYHHYKAIEVSVIDSLLKNIDMSMSTYISHSSISLLNQGFDIKLDSLMKKVIKRSIEICYETDGMFDITVAPLVDYWGFGPNKINANHLKSDISSYLIGCDQISLFDNILIKSDSVKIDLNGIAQGFTVDYIIDYLHLQEGVTDIMVEIGGEESCLGDNLGRGWNIGVDKPVDGKREMAFILNLKNIALATSGSYRNYYYVDSVKVNHTINPKTLKPTQNRLISATVLYSDCMTADAYATACMSFGFKDAKEFLAENNITGSLTYIKEQDTIHYSCGDFSSFLHRSPGSAPQ